MLESRYMWENESNPLQRNWGRECVPTVAQKSKAASVLTVIQTGVMITDTHHFLTKMTILIQMHLTLTTSSTFAQIRSKMIIKWTEKV